MCAEYLCYVRVVEGLKFSYHSPCYFKAARIKPTFPIATPTNEQTFSSLSGLRKYFENLQESEMTLKILEYLDLDFIVIH